MAKYLEGTLTDTPPTVALSPLTRCHIHPSQGTISRQTNPMTNPPPIHDTAVRSKREFV